MKRRVGGIVFAILVTVLLSLFAVMVVASAVIKAVTEQQEDSEP